MDFAEVDGLGARVDLLERGREQVDGAGDAEGARGGGLFRVGGRGGVGAVGGRVDGYGETFQEVACDIRSVGSRRDAECYTAVFGSGEDGRDLGVETKVFAPSVGHFVGDEGLLAGALCAYTVGLFAAGVVFHDFHGWCNMCVAPEGPESVVEVEYHDTW